MANEELRKSNMTDVSSPAEDAARMDAGSQVQDAVRANEGSQVQSPVSTDSGASAEEGMLEESTFRGEGMTYLADDPTLDAEEEETKRRIVITPRMIKLGTALVFSMIILIFATIAWFTMNRDVGTSEMGVKSTTLPFEIATKGELVRNNSYLLAVRPGYSEGVSGTLSDKNNVEDTYYTAENTDSLILRFDPTQVDDPETLDVDERYLPDIGPDSSGELSLYIIPKRDGVIDAYIDLDIISFKAIEVNNEEELVEITSGITTASGLTNNQIASCQEAANYLKGHVMFFEEISPSPSTYSYKKPVTDGKIHFHEDNAVMGKAYKVNIYWMWTNTFGQIALKTNANDLRDGIPVVQETSSMGTEESPTDKAMVLQYLKDNKDKFFADIDVYESLSAEEKAEYNAKTAEEKAEFDNETINTWIDSADTRKYFELLSDSYNNADFTIGTNLNYFMIEVTVKNGE